MSLEVKQRSEEIATSRPLDAEEIARVVAEVHQVAREGISQNCLCNLYAERVGSRDSNSTPTLEEARSPGSTRKSTREKDREKEKEGDKKAKKEKKEKDKESDKKKEEKKKKEEEKKRKEEEKEEKKKKEEDKKKKKVCSWDFQTDALLRKKKSIATT